MSMVGQKAGIRGGVQSQVQHDSAVKHVTGEAIFIDDIPPLPDTLEAVFLTSEHAHAKILDVDPEAALRIEGVGGVILAEDIPGKNDIAPVFENEPVLADGVVEYVGQPIAIILAETYDVALNAIKKIIVKYKVLKPVLTIKEALKRESYTFPPQTIERGNPLQGISGAKHKLKGKVSCGGQDHFYLEGQIALVQPGEDKDMLVYSSTQHPTEAQHGVANVLGVPVNDITVEVRRMGGAFGGKESQSTIIAAAATLLLPRHILTSYIKFAWQVATRHQWYIC